MATATASALATAPPRAPRRPRVLLVGSALGATASGLTVLTLLAVYLQVRADNVASGGTAFPKGTTIPLTPGTMGLVTLLMAGVTMAWVVYSLRNDDRGHAYAALGLTLVFGIAFLNSTVYLYQQLAMAPTSSPIAGLLYAATATHLVMVVLGMLFIAAMGFQALGGQLAGRESEGMNAAALYWYVTIAVYAVLWYAIYVTK
jgi:nitric oxide reductase NorE protein